MIALVVPIIFSYGPLSNIHGEGALCLWRGRGRFCFGPEKTQRREESGLKNFCIPISLTVLQPYKISVIYFLRDFIELFLKSVKMILVSRGKLSTEGRN